MEDSAASTVSPYLEQFSGFAKRNGLAGRPRSEWKTGLFPAILFIAPHQVRELAHPPRLQLGQSPLANLIWRPGR